MGDPRSTHSSSRELLGIAYCPHPRCECDTIPLPPHGICGFCDTVITHPDGRPLYTPDGLIVYKRQRASKHTPNSIVERIREFAAEHGHAPSHRDDYGLTSAARRVFGSWGAAITAAGVEPAKIGRPKIAVGSTAENTVRRRVA